LEQFIQPGLGIEPGFKKTGFKKALPSGLLGLYWVSGFIGFFGQAGENG